MFHGGCLGGGLGRRLSSQRTHPIRGRDQPFDGLAEVRRSEMAVSAGPSPGCASPEHLNGPQVDTGHH